MATRQITALFTNNTLKICRTNVPKYTTIAQGTGTVEKNIANKDFGSTKKTSPESAFKAGKTKEEKDREQPPGEVVRTPNPLTPPKTKLDEKLEDSYWQGKKSQQKHERSSTKKSD